MFRIRLPRRPRPDPYVVALLVTVLVAALLPVRGAAAGAANAVTDLAIAALFFLYGARLSSKTVVDGLKHWRLHLVVSLSTFALFPLLGLGASVLVPAVLAPPVYAGVLFLSTLPSTVQSSIAFTATARGNVAAAICSASLSNMAGIALTPLLVAWLMGGSGGGIAPSSVLNLVLQLLLPFVVGHLARRWIGDWIERHLRVLGYFDRGSILLVVYVAFSTSVVTGIWNQVGLVQLGTLFGVIALLLATALAVITAASRLLGFSRRDENAIVFCGSVKSLASGLPIASVLFPGATVGLVVLPVMLYHLLQLVVCAVLARQRGASEPEPAPVPAQAPAA
ncbi:sodium/bile acid cotransporter 7 [Saccharopolyspora erythraea NRRL 2338]|uniref:Sodium/bile acid symporter family protein n=2 Tax=Saccharopolyspora erythraea TaxID=1836 RepID=A4FCZ9_SACEN|nr:bile acid:sodium symporter family protein [Saccharopolyspora erythraea]EQD85901.1 membrane protein [Saccharopolyspora erythraea D]PFG95672.1 sodium/bile acid cotransporter 7 [Saccharopolyspora erythraea NRRL 2338]QRK92271.1 bile acid:sodium symporter [Saccharopolyspora erythraea]CAM01924.1 sodium/bile acid symporter family protein [Saccharopolyspora erythraea NRRL 2338]